MKYCKHCGTQLDDDAVFCTGCGARQAEQTAATQTAENTQSDNYFDNNGQNSDNAQNSGNYFNANGNGNNGGNNDGYYNSNNYYNNNGGNNGNYNNNNYYNNNGYNGGNNNPDDAPSAGFAVLCFFFPIIGLILWLVWQNTYPLKAKSCGKGALIGVIASIVLSIIASCYAAVAMGLFIDSVTDYYEAVTLLIK